MEKIQAVMIWRGGWKAVQILSVCCVCVSEDLLPRNENKTTIIVYIDVAWKLLRHLCSLCWLYASGSFFKLTNGSYLRLLRGKNGTYDLEGKWYSCKGEKNPPNATFKVSYHLWNQRSVHSMNHFWSIWQNWGSTRNRHSALCFIDSKGWLWNGHEQTEYVILAAELLRFRILYR